MADRDWTVKDVCSRCILEEKKLRTFLKGGIKLDEELAVELGHVFGTSATYWVNLENLYERGEV